MRRTVCMFLIVLVFLSVLTACWSRRELNELAITVAIGIDKQGEEYKISAQIVNPAEIASKQTAIGKGAPTTTYTESADSLFEAIRKMTTKSPRKIYVAHLRMLVIGEDLAREGIGKLVDFISRGQEFRTDFFIVVAKGGPAEKILRLYTIPQEVIPANNMFKSLQTAEKTWAATGSTTLDELTSDILSEGKDPVLTGIVVTNPNAGEEAETRENAEKMKMTSTLKFQGIAVFKGDKLIGWLNEDESTGLNFILGNVRSTVMPVSCQKDKIVLEVVRADTTVKGKVLNRQPKIEIEVQAEVNVAEVQCKIDLLKTETIAELEKKAEQEIKNDIEQARRKAQKEYHSDIFGFGEAIHRADPEAWKQLKADWDKQFANVPVKTKVDVKIRNLGTITQSLQHK